MCFSLLFPGLELCFGFLYGGPLDFIQDSNVENILATASFLEMVDIVDRVAMYLIRNSNIEVCCLFILPMGTLVFPKEHDFFNCLG